MPGARYDRFDAPSGALARFVLPGASSGALRGRVLLLPGLTGSKEDFALLAPLLAAAGLTAEAVDLAGQHESAAAGPPPGEPYTYELFVDDVVALLEAGEPAHLVGYSFAGIVAEMVALRRPDLVRSLTLVSTPPDAGNGFRHVAWVGWLSGLVGARGAAALMLWGVRRNLNGVDAARYAFVRDRLAGTRRSSVDDVIALMMATPDLDDQVRALPVPRLVAVARSHDLWPTHRHRAFAERIGASFAAYGQGHSPNETAPHQLAVELERLVARAAGRD